MEKYRILIVRPNRVGAEVYSVKQDVLEAICASEGTSFLEGTTANVMAALQKHIDEIREKGFYYSSGVDLVLIEN